MEQSNLKFKKTDRVNTGRSTNDLIHSAYQDTNDNIFPKVLDIYVPEKSKIADITYGRGVFWRKVDTENYDFYPSDLKKEGLPDFVEGGIDSRKLPYNSASFDAIVFAPLICIPPVEPLIMAIKTLRSITPIMQNKIKRC